MASKKRRSKATKKLPASKKSPAAKKSPVAKKLSRAAIERARAERARIAFGAFKTRSASSKKAAETRRKDPGSLYKALRNALSNFHETHKLGDYSRFRTAKRNLFKALPGQAYSMCFDATLEAGWGEREAMKFAKLS